MIRKICDQIRQKENRNLIGFNSTLFKDFFLGTNFISTQCGIGLRNDAISDIKLVHTVNRKNTLKNLYDGDILETNLYAFYDISMDLGRFTVNPGIRLDFFKFGYDDHLKPKSDFQPKLIGTMSPKMTITYRQNSKWQYYLKFGKGFHSNDTRGIIASAMEADTGAYKPVPAANGADLGVYRRLTKHLVLQAAQWYLQSKQEFVYVGDEGIVEASGRSQRFGLDFGLRSQIRDHWFAYLDCNLARARSIDQPSGSDYIPLAPNLTMTGGITYRSAKGVSGGLRMIHLGDRPANEDYSIKANGYVRFEVNVQCDFKRFTLGLLVQNLLNTQWKETQFATKSRLFNEPESVEEIHFTPGTPFAPRIKIGYRF